MGAGWLLFALLLPLPLHADLGSDMTRLQLAWAGAARVTRLPPRLLERGDVRPLLLPRDSIQPDAGGCVTVAVLAATSVSFVLRVSPAAGTGPGGDRAPVLKSVAGAAQLVRCGPERAELRRLAIHMQSPRGIVEALVAQSGPGLPTLATVLTHRDPGPSLERMHFAPRPREGPLQERLERQRERLQREGAASIERVNLQSGYAGAGHRILHLREGCHRFHVVGAPTPQGAPRSVDIDLDLLWLPSGQVAVSDHGQSADASATLCVARTRSVALRFVGAAPRTQVVLLMGRWDLPPGIPSHWGSTARAWAAAALRRLAAPRLTGPPERQWLGATGSTILPVELLPGACYVALVAAVTGQPRRLTLSALAGLRPGRTQAGPKLPGAALAFCSPRSDSGQLEVQAVGRGVAWVGGLWQVSVLPIGQEVE